MESTDILLITPPFTHLNTPYPATAFLSGFLQERGFKTAQLDLGIETFLHLFSRNGLMEIFNSAEKKSSKFSYNAKRIFAQSKAYIANIDAAISFMQGKDHTFAYSICAGILPRGNRFLNIPDLDLMFGKMGVIDKAKFLATLFIEDLGDFIVECVDSNFGFSNYAEKLGLNIRSFEPTETAIKFDTPFTDVMCRILEDSIQKHNPKAIALSVPFPGNFFSAMKSANYVKKNHPEIKVILGGGYINTELRELNNINVFDYVDYVCLDDGERPLYQILNCINGDEDESTLVRTFTRKEGNVVYIDNSDFRDFTHEEIGTPDYTGLKLDNYISVIEMANPMHRLWNDGRWNKLTIAHGCYWCKCTFCDTSLDYIHRYSTTTAKILCNRIESIIKQTGQRGFHFVDAAAPPTVLRDLAIELLRRNIKISWWANIRFEKAFTADLCKLLAESGCVAVSGGLEVASERLLEMINKGVTIEQVAKVASHFQQAQIMIHAYLMYGYPTQTEQETIDSMEVVRQFFENGLIDSAYWHRFTMTVHSPIGINPAEFKVERAETLDNSFAKNEIAHNDPTGCDHDKFSFGLKKSLYNYMHNICISQKLDEWFDFPTPKPQIYADYISDIIYEKEKDKPDGRVLWIGSAYKSTKSEKGKMLVEFEGKFESYSIELLANEAQWLLTVLKKADVNAENKLMYSELDATFQNKTQSSFKNFTSGKNWKLLRKNGLIVI